MHVVRFVGAPPYTTPGHRDMAMVRVQGKEAGPSSDLWIGVSVIAPGRRDDPVFLAEGEDVRHT